MKLENLADNENKIEETIQLVVFKLGNEEYAIDITYVNEIRKMIPITRVPRAADYYVGVINLRGKVLPVMNLKYRLGLPETQIMPDGRIIIICIDDISYGVTVDVVTEVMLLDKTNIENSTNIDINVEKKFVTGVGKHQNRLLTLLNVRELVDLTSD